MSRERKRFKFLTLEEFEALPTVDVKIAYLAKAADAAKRSGGRDVFRNPDQRRADDRSEQEPQ